ncbi:UNVERIFIED_CONTAM: hypothetical protein Sangu_3085300 [Sesamum angustifolium]|uniref:Uncharacterized protein n=1 Tax=Sesamum angustifolium TaxID=2727405 RepID=A0AAW2K8H1_9LAMI
MSFDPKAVLTGMCSGTRVILPIFSCNYTNVTARTCGTLLIEAIDMFLVGTAMLIFGVALHVMFVGQQSLKGKGSLGSTSSGNFNLEKLPSWIGMETAIQAKSKIGQAVIMILQVQVLEKCKSIPVVSGMDIACFAGAIFLSSASLFVLSKIAFARVEARW